MNPRKYLGPLFAGILALGVLGAIYLSYDKTKNPPPSGQTTPSLQQKPNTIMVRGLIGSEKEAYLSDPQVIQILRKNGIELKIDKAGSREIVGRYDPKIYDFGFPSGAHTANKLAKIAGNPRISSPLYSVMVVASWKIIAELLIANKIVTQEEGIYYLSDVKKLLDLMSKKTRWNQLNNNKVYVTNRSILINTTDVRKSNSGAMYLSLASYFANGEQVVQNDGEMDKILPLMADLFLRQGFQESSSSGPFEDYTALKMGKSPLVMIYESQMLEYLLKHPDGANEGMVLLYPKPTVFSKHVYVPFNANGEKLGKLLETDLELRKIAQEYGFRVMGTNPDLWKKAGISVPTGMLDITSPPSYEILEKMIVRIETQIGN